MTNGYRYLFLTVAVSTALSADVVVNTQLDLTALQITPASGTLTILSPLTVFTFAQALDSLGGFDANTDTVNDAATSVSATTTLANASGAASAPARTGSVTANVNLPELDAFANSTGQATLSGMFEITGVTGPVDVTFSALLFINQFLQTTGGGQSASSETIFTLLLGSDPVLFFDSPLAIGPDGTSSFSDSPNLTTSMLLQPDTPYSFVASLDAESNAVNVTPEPSSLGLALTLVGLLAVLGRLTRKLRAERRG